MIGLVNPSHEDCNLFKVQFCVIVYVGWFSYKHLVKICRYGLRVIFFIRFSSILTNSKRSKKKQILWETSLFWLTKKKQTKNYQSAILLYRLHKQTCKNSFNSVRKVIAISTAENMHNNRFQFCILVIYIEQNTKFITSAIPWYSLPYHTYYQIKTNKTTTIIHGLFYLIFKHVEN